MTPTLREEADVLSNAGEKVDRTHRAGRNPLRWRAVGWVLVVAAGLLGACSDLVTETTAPEVAGPRLTTSSSCGNGFTEEQCADIERALEYLQGHPDPLCQILGASAADRYYSGEFHYDGSTSDYGYMYTGSEQTYLGSAAFTPGELANTIAHEESHHYGYEDLGDGSANDAYAAGDACYEMV
jgi:hypothetical protein